MVCSYCKKDKPKGHNIRTCTVFQKHYAKQLAMIVGDVDITDIIKKILVSIGVPGVNLVFAAKKVYDAYNEISAATRMTKTQLKAEIVLKCVEIAKEF